LLTRVTREKRSLSRFVINNPATGRSWEHLEYYIEGRINSSKISGNDCKLLMQKGLPN